MTLFSLCVHSSLLGKEVKKIFKGEKDKTKTKTMRKRERRGKGGRNQENKREERE